MINTRTLTCIIGIICITNISFYTNSYAQQLKDTSKIDTSIFNVFQHKNKFQPKQSFPEPQNLAYHSNKENENSMQDFWDEFYPIGWSEDGKFAYVLEHANDGCGCYFFSIMVQNMITDEIIWKWEYDDTRNTDTISNLHSLWNENNFLFTHKLNQYKIEPVTFDKTNSFPILKRDLSLSCSIENNYTEDPNDYTFISKTRIYLSVDNKKKKLIYQKAYQTEKHKYSGYLSNRILGYLKNPFENRIAILYSPLQIGYEGPPHINQLVLIGCLIE